MTALKKALTKTQLICELAENTELSNESVSNVLDELSNSIERHLQKDAVGHFTLPGLLKIKTAEVPARDAQKGVANPFKPGEVMDVVARPASVKVKVTPLKGLKDMAL